MVMMKSFYDFVIPGMDIGILALRGEAHSHIFLSKKPRLILMSPAFYEAVE